MYCEVSGRRMVMRVVIVYVSSGASPTARLTCLE